MINISKQVIEQFITYAKQQYPFEACGLLTVDKNNSEIITSFIPIPNISSDPAHQYEFDPREFINLIYQLDTKEIKWHGVIHSHPTTSANPSILDIENWHYADKSYWIYSFVDNQLDAFEIKDKQVKSKEFEST